MATKSAKPSNKDDAPAKKPSRLGRGLSSLMAHPVEVNPPEPDTRKGGSQKVTPPESSARPTSNAAPVPPQDDVTTTSAAPPQASANATLASHPDQAHEREDAAGRNSPSASISSESKPRDPDQPTITYLAIEQITPNPGQPRRQFDPVALDQLADSIRSAGLMQPIIVRLAEKGSERPYQIVAGERRWRAAGRADLQVVPAIIRDLDDRQVAEWALIENLQREDLNPMDRAEAFRNLAEQFGLSHEDIAGSVGIERSTVSNFLRLLGLDESVQELVRQGMLLMGQARAIAGLTDAKLQKALAKQAVRDGWSVRRTEQAARAAATGSPRAHAEAAASDKPVSTRSTHLKDLEQQIGQQLGTKVRIRPGRKKGTGTLAIEFYSLDQFDTLLGKLGVEME